MAYLLDANVFIEAKNRYYGFDFCPAFWDWLIAENAAGRVFSVAAIADELHAGNDELDTWAAERGGALFLPPDAMMLGALPRISSWVTASQRYEPAAHTTFFESGEYYLIAHALAHGHVVVTHEIPSNSRKRVKIPEICIGVGIKFMTPFAMLRAAHARFVLPRAATR
jgi:hypothetical protein